MPRFAANLSMLFTEVDFLERFDAAAAAGFSGVEYLFPYDFSAEVIKARLDANRLEQVLVNLIGNAIKFTERGEVSVLVQRMSSSPLTLRFCVRDTGIGMTPQQKSRLFRAFSQANGSTTRQYGGTGLGLSIRKELMTKMHGTIGFDSVEGKGITFYITLPVLKSATE